MTVDLDKIQQKLEEPRKKKRKKKSAGFSAQKMALEATGYLARSRKSRSR